MITAIALVSFHTTNHGCTCLTWLRNTHVRHEYKLDTTENGTIKIAQLQQWLSPVDLYYEGLKPNAISHTCWGHLAMQSTDSKCLVCNIHRVQKKNTHSRFLLYLRGICVDLHKIFSVCLWGIKYSTNIKITYSLLPRRNSAVMFTCLRNNGFHDII